ncbi:MAG TPA: TIGR04086 family membrane protein [Chthoniobacterales bacterium]|nr:TIGR04086 family membrane protein [Chthoniobacterales bacterium]
MKEEQNRRAENAVYSAPGDAAYVASHTAGVVTKRISWGAIIGGTIIALVTQITLSLLGIGIGASTIHVQSGQTGSSLGSGSAVWLVLTILISLFAGGYVAGRLAGFPTKQEGMLHGLITFGLVTLLSLYFLTTALGAIIGGAGAALGSILNVAGQGIASAAPKVADAAQQKLGEQGIDLSNLQVQADELLRQTGKPQLQPENLQSQAKNAVNQNTSQNTPANPTDQNAASASDLINKLFSQGKDTLAAVDRDAAINVIVARTGKSREEAGQIVDKWQATYQEAKNKLEQAKEQAIQKSKEAADAAAKAATQAGLLGALAMVLGAVVAAVGGMSAVPGIVTVNRTVARHA